MREITENQRFWNKVDASGDCWLWTASKNAYGYGQFSVGYKGLKAHRFAWELLVGPIPRGKQIDHLCRIRHCVNPDHMEPVTQQENARRGMKYNPTNRCPKGHVYSGVIGGQRICSTCRQETSRRHNEKHKRM